MPLFADVPANGESDLSYGEMLDDLDDCGGLSDWELEFVDSLLRKRGDATAFASSMTDNQADKILEIWLDRCA